MLTQRRARRGGTLHTRHPHKTHRHTDPSRNAAWNPHYPVCVEPPSHAAAQSLYLYGYRYIPRGRKPLDSEACSISGPSRRRLMPLRLLLLPLSVLRVVGRPDEPSERAREPRVNVEHCWMS
jgi:hypothetical protein